jgi:hypothetical protein
MEHEDNKKRAYVFRASRTRKDGTKEYARDYGLKAFKIYIG